jgi:hypothetical protein
MPHGDLIPRVGRPCAAVVGGTPDGRPHAAHIVNAIVLAAVAVECSRDPISRSEVTKRSFSLWFMLLLAVMAGIWR